MKSIIYKISVINALALLLAILSCACTQEAEVPVMKPAGVSRVAFELTSLSSGDTYNPGNGFENFIDLDNRNFMFLFFDMNNRYICHMTSASVLPADNSESSKRYYLLGKVDGSLTDQQVKIVALANWGVYPQENTLVKGVTTIDDICRQQFSYNPDVSFPSADNPIPLYGVKELGQISWDENHFASLGRIHMLRAVAKVDIVADEISLPLEWVKVVRYNSAGFCAPMKVYLQSDYVHGNYDKDYVATPSIPNDCFVDSEITLTEDKEGYYTIYLPEFRNIGADTDKRASLMVKFVGVSTPYTIEFKQYGKDGLPPFDLLRNYWYRYTVNKQLTQGNPEITVDVQPYSSVELNPDFGLDRDENGNLISPKL